MADVKISALPAGAALDGSEIVPVVQSSSTVRTTAQAIANLTSLAAGATLYLNRQASNATGTVAFPTNFLPAAGATYTMGGLSLSWASGVFGSLRKLNGATLYDLDNNRVNDSSGNPSVYADAKLLRTGTHGAPVTKLDWSGASNLIFNMNFVPVAAETLDVGTSALRVLGTHANSYKLYNATSAVSSAFDPQVTTPSGATADLLQTKVAGRSICVSGANDAVNDGNKAGSVYVEGGNKTAGTGDGGDINITGGTSVGGAPGSVVVNGGDVAITATSSAGSLSLAGGSTDYISVNTSLAFVSNIPYADAAYSVQAPATGFNITITNPQGVLILTPAGTLATGTIVLPTTPINGRIVRVSSTQIVTALTVSGGGGDTLSNAPTTITAGGSFALIYIGTVWYPYT